MKAFNRILLALSLLVTSTLACGLGLPGNTYTIEVIANPGAAPWVQAAAEAFNNGRTKTPDGRVIAVEVQVMEAGQGVTVLAAGGAPALWMPDDPAWVSILAEKGQPAFQSDCTSTAQSPLVIAIWRTVAEALGWPGRSLGWLDIGSLAADPSAWQYYSGGQFGDRLRLSHTHPGLSHTGASTLLAVVQAALSKTDPVTAEEIQQPIVQASVGVFESAVSSFATDTDLLGQTMQQRGVGYLGAAVMYESTVLRYTGDDVSIVPIYPFEGTFVATHPACINGSADATTQVAARAFREHLLGEDAQNLAVSNGLRPVRAGILLAAPLDAAHGVKTSEPAIVFNSPSSENLYAVQALWQGARKNVNLVMVIDTSGSMQGKKIESVRAAALQFAEQMGDKDYLTLIIYQAGVPVVEIEYLEVGPNRATIDNIIRNLTANGGTPLYDSLGMASQVIGNHLSSQNTNAIVLLSDGKDTASDGFSFNNTLFQTAAAHDTTVFTIAYGSDADEGQLEKLATSANGNFYLGSEASIAAIYQEMSAAFGGSVGIGR
ncbi:MAG: VWA domain-containing protein [Chloroflexota bacterium]